MQRIFQLGIEVNPPNCNRNQVKLLLCEGDGAAAYRKRLEKGIFELPQIPDTGTASIGAQ